MGKRKTEIKVPNSKKQKKENQESLNTSQSGRKLVSIEKLKEIRKDSNRKKSANVKKQGSVSVVKSKVKNKEISQEKPLEEIEKQKAIANLTAPSSELLGREEEIEYIYKHIANGLTQGGYKNALYICGLPGTGKTESLNRAVARVQREIKENKIQTKNVLKQVYVNCMQLKEPKALYLAVAQQITNQQKIYQTRALEEIDGQFKKSKKLIVLLVVDELDKLMTKKQQYMYQLFNWPQQYPIILVGISNTQDLLEKLKPKIQSRLGKNKLIFKPYSRQQIQKIVNQKLEDIEIFGQDAIAYISAKIAQFSGDLRFVFGVCKKSIQLCKGSQVQIADIIKAYQQIHSSNFIPLIQQLREKEKLFVLSLATKENQELELEQINQMIQNFSQTYVSQY